MKRFKSLRNTSFSFGNIRNCKSYNRTDDTMRHLIEATQSTGRVFRFNCNLMLTHKS